MTINAKKQFIESMQEKTAAFIKRMGADSACAAVIMNLYPQMSDKAVQEMTLITCKANPDAFSLFVLTKACSAYLLDKKNDKKLFSNSKMTPMGESMLKLYQKALDTVSSDSSTPAGQHNKMQLDFVKSELKKRM